MLETCMFPGWDWSRGNRYLAYLRGRGLRAHLSLKEEHFPDVQWKGSHTDPEMWNPTVCRKWKLSVVSRAWTTGQSQGSHGWWASRSPLEGGGWPERMWIILTSTKVEPGDFPSLWVLLCLWTYRASNPDGAWRKRKGWQRDGGTARQVPAGQQHTYHLSSENLPQVSRHQRRWLGLSSLLGEGTTCTLLRRESSGSGNLHGWGLRGTREDSIWVPDPPISVT